ncbi:MAG: hypothetical protein EDM03_08770 [Porphyrobacter sp. IPPAS B-1204]|nr:MAG: hypothetical protein EDM03_08770 [Porphyrobacter sp. IPPAS B-1204]
MKHRLAILAALVATALGAPAAAEEAPDRDAMMQWGLALAGNVESDHGLIRMRDALCLVVAAEDQALAAKVARRVVDNAKDVGLPNRRGKCRPNAVIVLAEDAQTQLVELNEDRGRVYGSLYAARLDRILANETDGFAFQVAELLPNGVPSAFRRVQASRIQPGGTDMIGSLVVIDKAAAEGLHPVQLADYASLRLLAPTSDLHQLQDSSAESPVSILTLFRDRDRAPAEMTRFDRAYLESLYRLPQGSFARSIMARASKVALADMQP